MIEREEVDVGVTSFFATVKRQEVVDFSPIIDSAEYRRNNYIESLLSRKYPPRNRMFIKFPGRDLNGFLGFLKGLRTAVLPLEIILDVQASRTTPGWRVS